MSEPSPSSTDDALLARLNALKKSSVTFQTTHSASVTPTRSLPIDDLAARFARLGSASPYQSPKPPGTASINDTKSGDATGAPPIAPGAPSYLESIVEGVGGGDVEFNEEDEKSLEELLGQLGERNQWDLNSSEQQDVGKLLRDVKSILPEVQRSVDERRKQEQSIAPGRTEGNGGGKDKEEGLTDWENVEVEIGVAGMNVGSEGQQAHGEEENEKRIEDQEADDVIARVMAELAIDKKYSHLEEQEPEGVGEQEEKHTSPPKGNEHQHSEADSSLNLPSAPTSLPTDDLAATQALEDALTARLAALSKPTTNSLGLPSAPSFSPDKKPPKVTSSLPKLTDEEIDSWCIICNDDATLKCLGCDGDLYCQNCWMEGHRGESAGYEERRHKAVLFGKDKKKKEAAAGLGNG